MKRKRILQKGIAVRKKLQSLREHAVWCYITHYHAMSNHTQYETDSE
jgi:hypothetical protein